MSKYKHSAPKKKKGARSALTGACIGCARQAGYSQLELNVVAENTGAVALYRSLGFVEYIEK